MGPIKTITLLFILIAGARAAERPKKLYIDGHSWSVAWVQVVPLGTDWVGDTECKEHVIYIKIQPLTRDGLTEEQDTLFHELLHAFTCDHGSVHNFHYNSTTEDAHEGIYYLAPKLAEFMRYNTSALKWFAQDPKLQ